MSTQAQINANGQNAQKSTGPRTTDGKATASQNAIKHGLSAKYDVISSESQADFDLHRQRLLDDLSPVGPIESMLAERVVSLSWRLERTVRIQNQVFDAKIFNSNNPSPLIKLTQSILPKHLKQNQTESPPELELGQLAIKDFANSRVLDRLLMYERRMENSLYKTMLELQRLRLTRNLDTLASIDKQIEETWKTDHQHPRAQTFDATLQNEPNFQNAKINTTHAYTKNYEKKHHFNHPKNEPNSNPISANAKNQHKPILHRDLQRNSSKPPEKTNPIKPNTYQRKKSQRISHHVSPKNNSKSRPVRNAD